MADMTNVLFESSRLIRYTFACVYFPLFQSFYK